INYNVPRTLGGGNGFPVGSTFKPFVLQDWLEHDRSIYDKVSTERRPISKSPAKCLSRRSWRSAQAWNPDNAVSVRIQPMETVLNATRFSINTAYTDMARQLDLCEIAETARSIGVVPAGHDPYDPSTYEMPIEDVYGTELAPAVLVLGEVRISALDMASAYATWAAGGTYCKPQAISEVLDRNGDPIAISGHDGDPRGASTADGAQGGERHAAAAVAGTPSPDRADPKATGKGRTIPGHPAGGKTGTSGEQSHTWYVGFTRQMSTAVWFGHPS